MLTREELTALEQSKICLHCHHRKLLHHHDFRGITACRICESCEDFMAEGATSVWSAPDAQARKHRQEWYTAYNALGAMEMHHARAT